MKLKDWLHKETSLVQTFFILIFVYLMLDALPQDPEVPMPSYSVLVYILSVVSLALSLLCIRYIRGNNPVLYNVGYIWRYVVTSSFTFLIFALLSNFILRVNIVDIPTEINLLFTLLLTPIVVWMFFCKERIEFLKKVIVYFKGM